MAKPIEEKSCGVILYRNDGDQRQFLLLHYTAGHWDYPKGHVEEGETEEQTALRELEEEAGIKNVEIKEGFREPINYLFTQDGQKIHKTVVFFCAETKESEVQISHEHQNHKWLPYIDAYEKLTFDNAKGLLTKAHNFLERS